MIMISGTFLARRTSKPRRHGKGFRKVCKEEQGELRSISLKKKQGTEADDRQNGCKRWK
jgi:hypothetical protein